MTNEEKEEVKTLIQSTIKSENKKSLGKESIIIFISTSLALLAQSFLLNSTHSDRLDAQYKSQLISEYKNVASLFNKISSMYLYQNKSIIKERKDLIPFKHQVDESFSNLRSLLDTKERIIEVDELQRQSNALIDEIFNTNLARILCEKNDEISNRVCESTLNLRNLRITVAKCHFCLVQKSILSTIGKNVSSVNCRADYIQFLKDIKDLKNIKLRNALNDEIKKSIDVYKFTPPYSC